MERVKQDSLKSNPYVGTTFYKLGDESVRIIQEYVLETETKNQFQNLFLNMSSNPFVGFFRHSDDMNSLQSSSTLPESYLFTVESENTCTLDVAHSQMQQTDTNATDITTNTISTNTTIVTTCEQASQTDFSSFNEEYVFI